MSEPQGRFFDGIRPFVPTNGKVSRGNFIFELKGGATAITAGAIEKNLDKIQVFFGVFHHQESALALTDSLLLFTLEIVEDFLISLGLLGNQANFFLLEDLLRIHSPPG